MEKGQVDVKKFNYWGRNNDVKRIDVFKPFFRLDKSRSLNQSGVGLGLAIVEDIINSHGGNIQLSKSKYNGLQVKISLPI